MDFAFVGLPSFDCAEVVTRALDRHEIVVVMTPANHLAAMNEVPIESLRGEPIIAVSSVLGSPHVAAARRWLGNHLGRDLNIVAEEQAGTQPLFKGVYAYPADLVIEPQQSAPLAKIR